MSMIEKKSERKGFCPALYEGKSLRIMAWQRRWRMSLGWRSCSNNKHIHVPAKRDFVSHSIARAEPEIQGSHRERHVKSLDIAEEEIFTCLGIYLFERFDKILRTMKSEEQAWQYLYCIAIDCCRMSMKTIEGVGGEGDRRSAMWSFDWIDFERALDRQQDLRSTWDSLCEEFRLTDQLKFSKKKHATRKSRSNGKSNERGVISMIQLSRSVLRSIKRRMVLPVPNARSRRWYVRLNLWRTKASNRWEMFECVYQCPCSSTRERISVFWFEFVFSVVHLHFR